MATLREIIGERVYQLRTSMGISQGGLADQLKVTRGQVSNVEAGRSAPSLETLIALTKILGVSADVLLGLQPIPLVIEYKKHGLVPQPVRGADS